MPFESTASFEAPIFPRNPETPRRVARGVKPALDDLSVPAPIHVDQDRTGPAALAMAAAALDGADASRLVDRIDVGPATTELARWALSYGYHVTLYTDEGPASVDDRAREAGLTVAERATLADVREALAARHALIASAPGDSSPFLLVLREDEEGLVVVDPSLDEGPVTWEADKLAEMLEADPAPCLLELAPRSRAED